MGGLATKSYDEVEPSYATPGEMELFSWHWTSWEDSTRPSYPRLVVINPLPSGNSPLPSGIINDSQNGQNILRVPVLGTPAKPCFAWCSGLTPGMLYTVCLGTQQWFLPRRGYCVGVSRKACSSVHPYVRPSVTKSAHGPKWDTVLNVCRAMLMIRIPKSVPGGSGLKLGTFHKKSNHPRLT